MPLPNVIVTYSAIDNSVVRRYAHVDDNYPDCLHYIAPYVPILSLSMCYDVVALNTDDMLQYCLNEPDCNRFGFVRIRKFSNKAALKL
jgi:hypothetical protein